MNNESEYTKNCSNAGGHGAMPEYQSFRQMRYHRDTITVLDRHKKELETYQVIGLGSVSEIKHGLSQKFRGRLITFRVFNATTNTAQKMRKRKSERHYAPRILRRPGLYRSLCRRQKETPLLEVSAVVAARARVASLLTRGIWLSPVCSCCAGQERLLMDSR